MQARTDPLSRMSVPCAVLDIARKEGFRGFYRVSVQSHTSKIHPSFDWMRTVLGRKSHCKSGGGRRWRGASGVRHRQEAADDANVAPRFPSDALHVTSLSWSASESHLQNRVLLSVRASSRAWLVLSPPTPLMLSRCVWSSLRCFRFLRSFCYVCDVSEYWSQTVCIVLWSVADENYESTTTAQCGRLRWSSDHLQWTHPLSCSGTFKDQNVHLPPFSPFKNPVNIS